MTLQDRIAVLTQAPRPNIFDLVALILVIGAMVLIVYGGEQTTLPLSALNAAPVSLDPTHLPFYALRTTMRMLLAIVCSVVFTFVYAAVAAKSRRAEMVLIPILDILQSVPILGFLTFTVVFFLNLFRGNVLGAELACVFAIFTSQAWNMTFSMYQSIRNVPKDLEEATQSFHLSGWQRFWRLEVPFAMPGLIWNAMMSMSGGWFFVVASEAITVGNTTVTLPGVGSYVELAIEKRSLPAIGYALLTMLIVIIIYDQCLFRPIVAWADKFRFEEVASGSAPTSWMLDLFRRTRALRALTYPFAALNRAFFANIGRTRRQGLDASLKIETRRWRAYIAYAHAEATYRTGFIEPGETIEEAVRRELMEEASVKVGEVSYWATQPWPFPSSLMIGCFAKATSRDVKVDQSELAEVRWIERKAARELIEGKRVDGIMVPPPIAIAHHLIKAFALGER